MTVHIKVLITEQFTALITVHFTALITVQFTMQFRVKYTVQCSTIDITFFRNKVNSTFNYIVLKFGTPGPALAGAPLRKYFDKLNK